MYSCPDPMILPDRQLFPDSIYLKMRGFQACNESPIYQITGFRRLDLMVKTTRLVYTSESHDFTKFPDSCPVQLLCKNLRIHQYFRIVKIFEISRPHTCLNLTGLIIRSKVRPGCTLQGLQTRLWIAIALPFPDCYQIKDTRSCYLLCISGLPCN